MKRFLLSLCLVGWITCGFGQSISELRAKKSNAEKQLKQTNALLEEARKSEQASLNRLQLLSSQIAYRGEIISGINHEIELVDWRIQNNSEINSLLQHDLDALRAEYAAMIRFAQKSKNSYDVFIFLLSADNMNQAYKRWLYLRQYATYRKSQTEDIHLVANLISDNITRLEAAKQEKTALLNSKLDEQRVLEQEKGEQGEYISSLQKKQKDLKSKIQAQQKEQDELNNRIQRLLEEEARKAAEKGKSGLSGDQIVLSADFSKNKGLLPWPVEKGVIIEKFGVHPHPVLKQIQVRSNGISISTAANTKARTVFAGEVSRVFAISGGNMAVIIRHGSFLSVYSNLRDVRVKQGQKVAIKEEIGTVFTDKNDGNSTVLKFQIWKESQKLNPEEWITR